MRKKAVSCLLSFCSIHSIIIGIPALAGTTPFFSTLSMRDGLPSNIIGAMAQDKYGFMWIATGSGVARYDGYNFKIFSRGEQSNTLPSNELSAIIADDDYIWAGTWSGLCKINVTTFEVTRVNLGGNNTIRTLHKGKNHLLWIGTATGLIRYSVDDNRYSLFNSKNSGLSHNMIRTIYEDSRGNLWAGTYDKLNKLPKGTDHFITLDLKGRYRPSLKNHLVLDIKPTSILSDSMVWVGTETGLYKLNTYDHSFTHYGEQDAHFSNEVIKCIYIDQESNLWLGTDFGLNVFNPREKTNTVHFHNPQLSYSIPNNVTWQIFEDKGGVIWFGTSNGLGRLNKYGNFYTYHEISHHAGNQLIGNQVRSMLISSNGIYWFSTQHGVMRIDPKTNSTRIFDTRSANNNILLDNVYTIEEDNFGQIWIGTAGGINVWNEARNTMHAITANPSNGLTSNYIGKFSKTSDGSLWVSGWEGGLFKIEGDLQRPESVTFKAIPRLTFGSEKHTAGGSYMWAVEYDELYRIDPTDFTIEHIKSFGKASSHQMIYCIYFSKKGHLWAGTQDGLLQYVVQEDKTYFHPIRTTNESTVSSIIEDNDGNIWSTSNTSLQKFNPENLSMEVYPLDKNIPLKSFFYGCAARNTNQEILFGGDNGYISFLPDRVRPNRYKPEIYVTSVEINNKRVSTNEEVDGVTLLKENDVAFTKELVLKYEQRSVTFEFSSLDFWQPAMNSFTYKLDGFDKDWTYTTGLKNFAVYSNLPAGNYNFIVRGTNNYGIESDQTAVLSVRVSPPLFLKSGFIVAYIIVTIAIIYYALRTYSARVHLKNELKIIRMEKEHAEELEHTKEKFFTNISHELRTPISLILPPIHELQKKNTLDTESKELISLAERNSVRLLRLVNQILDFNKLETDTLQISVYRVEMVAFCREIFSLFRDQAHRQAIDFNFVSMVPESHVWVDMEKVETILFNLLSNAFKFTPHGGKITFTISVIKNISGFSEGAFEIVVADSGIGISKEESTRIFERFYQSEEGKKRQASSGIGLTLTAEYVKLHHGNIAVESDVGAGASFIVRLPLGKMHFPADFIHENEAISLLATKSLYSNKEGVSTYQIDLKSDKPLVLIIDDNADIITFIRSSLASKYNFVIAENGEEGLTKANNFLPQVIISDIMMPVMDGLTFCKRVKENPKTSHIAVILLTAKSMTSQRVEGIRTGADVYLTKPFELDLLEAHIDSLIQRKKELTDYFRNELITQPAASNSSNNEDNKFIRQVMDIIEANITDPHFGVEMISEKIGISSTHLYRKLKAITNHSAKDIIKKYRIKKASLLLKNKEGNISEIMYDVGFSNLSYFSKSFRAEFGLTPKEYQQKMSINHVDIDNDLLAKTGSETE